MKKIQKLCCALLLSSFLTTAYAASITVPMYFVAKNGQGQSIGSVKIEAQACGVLLIPDLHGLPPGPHGFHVHDHSSCAEDGQAAGGHLDPTHSGKHEGPYAKQGHLGDLPVLIVDEHGNATLPTLAPKFKLKDLANHSLMIHAGADNYADTPEKLGGGGARIACGIIG